MMSTVEKTTDGCDSASKSIDLTETSDSELSLTAGKDDSNEHSQPVRKEGTTQKDELPKNPAQDDNEKKSPVAISSVSCAISKPESMAKENQEKSLELTNGIDKGPEEIVPLSSELMAESEDLPDTVILADSEEIKKKSTTEIPADKENLKNSEEHNSHEPDSVDVTEKTSQPQEEKLDNSQNMCEPNEISEKLVSSSTPSYKKNESTINSVNSDNYTENESQSFSLHLSQTQLFSPETTSGKNEENDSYVSDVETKNKEDQMEDKEKQIVAKDLEKSTEVKSEQNGNAEQLKETDKAEEVEEKENVDKAEVEDCSDKSIDKAGTDEIQEEETTMEQGEKDNTGKISSSENKVLDGKENEEASEEKKVTTSTVVEEPEDNLGVKEDEKDGKQNSCNSEDANTTPVKSNLKPFKSTRKSLRYATKEKLAKKENEAKVIEKNSVEKNEEEVEKPETEFKDGDSDNESKGKTQNKKSVLKVVTKKEKLESPTEIQSDTPQKKKTTQKMSSSDEEGDSELKSQIKEYIETISMKLIKYLKSKSRNDNILYDCLAHLKEMDSLVGGSEAVEDTEPRKNQRQTDKVSRSKKEPKTPLKRKSKDTKSEETGSVSPPKKLNTGRNDRKIDNTAKNGLAVFAKWPNSGWYYPGIVEGLAGNEWKDSSNVTVCFYDGLRREMKNINILPAHVIPTGSVLCSIDDETEMSVITCERKSENCVNFTLVKKDKEDELVQLNFNKLAVKGLNMKSIKLQLEQLNVDIVPKNMHVVSLDNLVCGRRSRGRTLIMKDSPLNKKVDTPSKKDSGSSNESNSPEKKVEEVSETPVKSTPSKRRIAVAAASASSNKSTPTTKRRASARQSVKQN